MDGFQGLASDLKNNSEAWQAWSAAEEPHQEPLPGVWEGQLDDFKRLIIIKVFREEKVVFGMQSYVASQLGKRFTESLPWTLDDVFPDTTARIPVIFVLSTGRNPKTLNPNPQKPSTLNPQP